MCAIICIYIKHTNIRKINAKIYCECSLPANAPVYLHQTICVPLVLGVATLCIGLYYIFIHTRSRKIIVCADDPVGIVYTQGEENGFSYKVLRGPESILGYIGIRETETKTIENAGEKYPYINTRDKQLWFQCAEGPTFREVRDDVEFECYSFEGHKRVVHGHYFGKGFDGK